MSELNGTTWTDPDKRRAILDQAIRTFAELGFRGTDVQVIADRAGVGKGTVYRYFRKKEDLFWAATFEVLLRLERELFAAVDMADTARDKIRAAAMAYAQFFEANPQYLEMFVQDRAEFRGSGPESHREYHQKIVHRFEQILRQGVEAGELRPMNTRQTTHALGNLLYGTVVLGCHLNATVPTVEMAQYGIDVFLRGLQIETHEPVEAQSERNIS